MRISDWSSDVCASDLSTRSRPGRRGRRGRRGPKARKALRGRKAIPDRRATLARRVPKARRATPGRKVPKGGRKSVGVGTEVSVRVDHGGRLLITKKQQHAKRRESTHLEHNHI